MLITKRKQVNYFLRYFRMEKVEIDEFEKEINIIHNVDLIMHDMKTVNQLCTQQYYKHKKGCPNFNRKNGCPPTIYHISQEYDLSSIHLLYVKFPFLDYISKKGEIHSDWNLRQLANQRHWQGHLRSSLDMYWGSIRKDYPYYRKISNPEGQGVNVEDTLKQYDIQLDWCKKDEQENIVEVPEYMYYVYLIGKSNNGVGISNEGEDIRSDI